MIRSVCCLTCAALSLLPVRCATADIVTLLPGAGGFPTGANVNALAGPLFGSDLTDSDIAGSTIGTVMAALGGNTATHDFGVELDYSMAPGFFDSVYSDFARTSVIDPVLGGHRASAESIFHFTVDVPTAFEVTGFFAVDDAPGTTVAGNVELEVELLEFDSPIFSPVPPPTTKLYSYQKSESTIDEGLLVGGADGDAVNVFDGSLTGMLDPTKFYKYRTLVTMVAFDVDGAGPMLPTDGSATATGAQTIIFTAATAVPEPSAAWLLSLAAAWSVGHRRRRTS